MDHVFDLSPILNYFGKRSVRLISTTDFFKEMGLQNYYLHAHEGNDASIEPNAWNLLEERANIVYLEDSQRHSYRFYDSSTTLSNDVDMLEQEADASKREESSKTTLEFSYDYIDLQSFKSNKTIMEFMKRTHSGKLKHSNIVYHQAKNNRNYKPSDSETPTIFQVIRE
jgi:hypothetical protein